VRRLAGRLVSVSATTRSTSAAGNGGRPGFLVFFAQQASHTFAH
jgi:hypothetical protein